MLDRFAKVPSTTAHNNVHTGANVSPSVCNVTSKHRLLVIVVSVRAPYSTLHAPCCIYAGVASVPAIAICHVRVLCSSSKRCLGRGTPIVLLTPPSARHVRCPCLVHAHVHASESTDCLLAPHFRAKSQPKAKRSTGHRARS